MANPNHLGPGPRGGQFAPAKSAGHALDPRRAVEGSGTALHRSGPSQPLKYLLSKDLVKGSVLDYGAGHGADVRHLRAEGKRAEGWDPAHAPNPAPLGRKYDTVLNTYVLNVLKPDAAQRVIHEARARVARGGSLYVTVRRDIKGSECAGRGVTQRRVVLAAQVIAERSDFAIYRFGPLEE